MNKQNNYLKTGVSYKLQTDLLQVSKRVCLCRLSGRPLNSLEIHSRRPYTYHNTRNPDLNLRVKSLELYAVRLRLMSISAWCQPILLYFSASAYRYGL